MSTNVVKVNGNYKVKTVQGGNITLDSGSSGTINIIGNLSVTGESTHVFSESTEIKDNVIYLNSGENVNHDGISLGSSGIEINRGGAAAGNGQLFFVEGIPWQDPTPNHIGTKYGLFVFQTSDAANGGICGIRTRSINTGGTDLNLINGGNGVISVIGTSNYEDNVTDDDHIPNRKFLYNSISNITAAGKVHFTQPETTATLTIAEGKTLTANSTLTFSGTDSSSVAFGGGGTVVYTSTKINALTGITSTELASKITGTTGTDNLVFSTSPSFTTPTIGVATATSINKVTITAPASSSTLTIADGKTLTANSTLTFSGTDGSTVVLGTGGTVLYTTSKLSTSFFASSSSADLRAVINDETGSGKLVFASSPTLTTPVISSIVNTGTLTLPTSTDTLVGRATTDTFTNKTYDTAGTGNVFKINGTQVSDKTGTGKVVLDTSPTIGGHPTIEGITSTGATGTGKLVFSISPSFTTPSLGEATVSKINGLLISTTSDSALTISSSKVLAVYNSLAFRSNDEVEVQFKAGGTVLYETDGYIKLTSLSIDLQGTPSGTGQIQYNDTTGKFKYTPPDLSSYIHLTSLSMDTPGTASSDGNVEYDNSTGKFKYTPPDLSTYVTQTQLEAVGTPWTSQGYLTAVTPSNFSNQNANKVLAGPATGSDNNPTFRSLVSNDLPTISDPTTSSVANSVGFLGKPVLNVREDYTSLIRDIGKLLYVTEDNLSITIQSNSILPYPIGTTIDIIDYGSSTGTNIIIISDTMRLAGSGSTGNRHLSPYGRATLIKVNSTVWFISGFGLT